MRIGHGAKMSSSSREESVRIQDVPSKPQWVFFDYFDVISKLLMPICSSSNSEQLWCHRSHAYMLIIYSQQILSKNTYVKKNWNLNYWENKTLTNRSVTKHKSDITYCYSCCCCFFKEILRCLLFLVILLHRYDKKNLMFWKAWWLRFSALVNSLRFSGISGTAVKAPFLHFAFSTRACAVLRVWPS